MTSYNAKIKYRFMDTFLDVLMENTFIVKKYENRRKCKNRRGNCRLETQVNGTVKSLMILIRFYLIEKVLL